MNQQTQVRAEPASTAPETVESFWPQAPDSIAEMGLPGEFLAELTLKLLFVSGPGTMQELAARLCVSIHLADELMAALKTSQSIEAMGSAGFSDLGIRYRLTGKGTQLAAEALERSRYVGPVPITLNEYTAMALRQSLRKNPPTTGMLEATFEPFVLRPDVKESLARIFFSGRTVMIYGESGNGKTAIVESYAKTFTGAVLYPQSLYVAGQVIRIYDPVKHTLVPVEESAAADGPMSVLISDTRQLRFDKRWIKIRRPVVVVGGELEPEQLDLTFDDATRQYQAPAHMKAQDGIFMIDDFGRQRARPEEILNRWIVPMESAIDHLMLQTGDSFTIPFEIALIFSSNLKPHQLADEAFLRRIPYKINLPTPEPELFADITRMWCKRTGVTFDDVGVQYLTRKLFSDPKILPRATHPRDIAQMILDYARYDGAEPILSPKYIDKTVAVYFINET